MSEAMFEVEVAEVGLAPVKSMEFLHGVDALTFDDDGLFGDREFMLVEAETGKFLSLRKDPVLTQFEVGQTDNGIITLKHRLPGRESEYRLFPVQETDENTIDVSVHKWNGKAVDQGTAAAHWISEKLGKDVRIVRRSEKFPRFSADNPEQGKVGFADGHPLLVGSVSTIDTINEVLAEADESPITKQNLRGNVWLRGLEAFGEDNIGELSLSAGGLMIVMERSKACERCLIIDTDPKTGKRVTVDGKPTQPALQALRTLGRSGRNVGNGDKRGTFALQNFSIKVVGRQDSEQIAELRQGDVLRAAVAEHPNWVPLDR